VTLEQFVKSYPNLNEKVASLIVKKSDRIKEDGVEWKWNPLTRDWITTHDLDRCDAVWEGVDCQTLALLGKDFYGQFWSKLMSPGIDFLHEAESPQ
jgi:hypothetical protein